MNKRATAAWGEAGEEWRTVNWKWLDSNGYGEVVEDPGNHS